MPYTIEIKEEAKEEIIQATQWYAQKVKGLEIRFIGHLESVINNLLNNPKTYKRVYRHFRQAALKKFPSVVVYEFTEDKIIVYSVFHAKQNPLKKILQLKK